MTRIAIVTLAVLGLAMPSVVHAGPINQFASSVLGFSSSLDPGTGEFSPAQALGAPNTPSYGHHATAWSPGPMNGSFPGALESISLGFTTEVYADGFTIWESNGNGFVTAVELIDTNGNYHVVFGPGGDDPSLPGSIEQFSVDFARTSFLVKGLRIWVDPDANPDTWEAIDAVELRGDDTTPGAAVPEPSSLALLSIAGVAGAFRLVRRRGSSPSGDQV